MSHNVLIITRSLPCHTLGGMELITYDLAQELVLNQGCDVTVLTTEFISSSHVNENVFDLRYVHGTTPGKYSNAWWKKSVIEAEKIILEKNIDTILSVSAGAYKVIKLKKKYPHIKFIFQAHGTSLGEITSKIRSRKLKSIIGIIKNIWWVPKDIISYNKFDCVVAVGDYVYTQLTRGFLSKTYRVNKCKLIRNGVSESVFRYNYPARCNIRKKYNLEESNDIFLTVSRLHKEKGISESIEVFNKIHKKNKSARYFIIGDGPDRVQIGNIIESLHLEDSVFLIGPKSRNEVAEFLSAADCFVFLSKRVEVGLTLTLLEALTSKLPILFNENVIVEGDVKAKFIPTNSLDELDTYILNGRKERRLPSTPDYSLTEMAKKYKKLFSVIRDDIH